MTSDMQPDYAIRRISSLEYHRMGELGIIGHEECVELLDGELIALPPIGTDHAYSVRVFNDLFVRTFAGRAIVDIQNPLRLNDFSEVEPDVVLLKPREDWYRSATPGPGDVLLVVEIASASWRYDRGRKLRAYARAGIAELWLVHLTASTLHVFNQPAEETYRSERSYTAGDFVAASAFPGDVVPVAPFLP